jgi:hypothetical protein
MLVKSDTGKAKSTGVGKSGITTRMTEAWVELWDVGVNKTNIRKSSRAAATAGSPYTTACSPKRIAFPGAEAHTEREFINGVPAILFLIQPEQLTDSECWVD